MAVNVLGVMALADGAPPGMIRHRGGAIRFTKSVALAGWTADGRRRPIPDRRGAAATRGHPRAARHRQPATRSDPLKPNRAALEETS